MLRNVIVILILFMGFLGRSQQLETSLSVGVLPTVDQGGYYSTGAYFDFKFGYMFKKGTSLGVVGKVGWYPRNLSNFLTSKVGVYAGQSFYPGNGFVIRPTLSAGLFITTLALKKPSSLRYSFYGVGVGVSCEFGKRLNEWFSLYTSVGFESGTVFDYGEAYSMFSFPVEFGLRFNFGERY